MPDSKSTTTEIDISRDRLAELLNEDLSREYQAIIAYVVYSQVLSGAQYMDIAAQLAAFRSAADVGNFHAEGGREVDLMVLLLHEDLADLLRHRVFA